MRIAICFSGQVNRITDPNVSFLQTQLSKYKEYDQCDLFFSHWDGTIDKPCFADFLQTVLPGCMMGKYSVADIEFTSKYMWSSKYQQKDIVDQSRPHGLEAMFLQAAGIKNVDLLRQNYEEQNNFTYDIVIRARADINIIGEYDLPKYKKLLDHNSNLILLPKNHHHPSQWDNQGMLCDHWFAATSKLMSRITTLVDHIDEYVDCGARLHPETLLWWHIVRRINANYEFQDFRNILRGIDYD